jgi:hypothetical protein
MCRKHHGAPFATYGVYPPERLRITAGADRIKTYESSATIRRQFCEICGSSLFFIPLKYPDRIAVALGVFDDDPGKRPEFHLFVGSKAGWHEITDDLPQYENRP